jgi:hypothetical protein
MSFSRPIPDVLTPLPGSLIRLQETGEFDHAALVEFAVESGLDGPTFAERWLTGVRMALLILADGPLRNEGKDAR